MTVGLNFKQTNLAEAHIKFLGLKFIFQNELLYRISYAQNYEETLKQLAIKGKLPRLLDLKPLKKFEQNMSMCTLSHHIQQ